MHGLPLLSFPFLCLFSSAGLMSITVALVDASLLSLRRASEQAIKNGRGVIRDDTRSPRRRRRIASVLVTSVRRTCFTWRRRSITLGDLLAGAKDVPSGCTVACILFVHFVHTVKASRKASPSPARTERPGKSTYIHVQRRRSLFLHVRASPKRRLTYTWMKKDIYENCYENRIISRFYIFFDQSEIDFPVLFESQEIE